MYRDISLNINGNSIEQGLEQDFAQIKSIIEFHRSRASKTVNEESLMMSWRVGQYISEKLKTNEWGAKVVMQLSEYLRTQDPDLKGYSRRNIYNMVSFYEAYSSLEFISTQQRYGFDEIVQFETAQLPVAHIPVAYHRGLRCLIAMELKSKKFKPADLGQLEFYLEALDRDVKRSDENPSIGILLCQTADKHVVEYAMNRSMSPTLITQYKRMLIPQEVLQRSLDEYVELISK